MYENDSTLRNGDESNDKPQKLESSGEARSLEDYTDLAEELDCLQLEDDSEEDDR